MFSVFRRLRYAFAFLTVLPFPSKDDTWSDEDFSKAAMYYPVVGLVIGAITFLGTKGIYLLTGSLQITAFVGVLIPVVLTGGIHLDGFMDTCDGLLSHRGAERALEIMKDSRVGSFAVISVVLLLLGKYVLYLTLFSYEIYFFDIAAIFVFSRLMMLAGITFFPGARDSGLGASVQKYSGKNMLILGVVLFIALAYGNYSLWLLMPFALVCLFYVCVSKYLNGLTGDIYGAGAELSEFLFLVTLILINPVD